MKVIVLLSSTDALTEGSRSQDPSVVAGLDVANAPVELDLGFAPVAIPQPLSGIGAALAFSTDSAASTYAVRGEIPDGTEAFEALSARSDVVGVFADAQIESSLICPGSPPFGSHTDVAQLLDVSALAAAGMDGRNVPVAIVDTGINVAHLQGKGRSQGVDTRRSYTPSGVATQPGAHVVGHGTMCAYDVGIAAPAATLLDHAVLLSQRSGPTVMSGFLSDAIASYGQMLMMMLNADDPMDRLVVSNSWGMFDPAWDFPVGHPGNYSDNSQHPFNLVVASLEALGADILFAAGNCGRDCPDGRCNFGPAPSIGGANSHPSVLSVAGVDTSRTRVGYSSQGPGRLSAQKPDICGYTHFLGSEAFGPGSSDSGTSAACPVAAGVVAAVRSLHSSASLSPQQLRALIQKTAVDLGGVGFDNDHGWGVVDPTALLAALPQGTVVVPPPFPGRLLRYPPYTQGTDVQTWQRQMVTRGYGIKIDGIYGPESKQACTSFQGSAGLSVDGIVGPLTWEATWAAPI
ncbi:S8 family serine peptidase [Nocardioides stalactiti]|uniref:S8 family serine peptidase n=1 Tax=Nocardioides stalactiti TaxID=2755356 RepID=UPI001C808AB9|nr:S8 family serine peptidase [Nocardioides stalactiti]